MTLIIEDGTLVTGANSYITAAELTTYLTDRGYSEPTTAEPLIIRVFDYMCSLNWKASHLVAYTVLDAHKKAQCEMVYRFSLGLDSAATPAASVKSKKVDVLETEYFSNPAISSPAAFLRTMPQAAAYLKGLLAVQVYNLAHV